MKRKTKKKKKRTHGQNLTDNALMPMEAIFETLAAVHASYAMPGERCEINYLALDIGALIAASAAARMSGVSPDAFATQAKAIFNCPLVTKIIGAGVH